ncbi:MAG: MerR family transcriptional regulator [Myxococcales bacterium]|nr:MerR family transcriptional regulator [Myxococcales bacterium]
MSSELPDRGESDQSEYSIGVTSRLTGITPDKLRIWERRYGFPVPSRTAGGARVYSDADVNRLVLIRRAMDAGARAGEAVQMSEPELKSLLQRSAGGPRASVAKLPPPELETVLRRLKLEDVDFVRDALADAAESLGPERFAVEYAAPLIERVGGLWEAGELAVRHEHLFSQALSSRCRQLLFDTEPDSGPVLLLATLPDEQHGLGLELVSLIAASHGVRPRMIGVNTPLDDIVEAAAGMRAHAVGLSVALGYDVERARASIHQLLERLPRFSALWVGGAQASELRFDDSRYAVVTDLKSLTALLDVLRLQHG